MKSSKKDKVEGTVLRTKGKIKEIVGKAVGDKDLEAEGKVENLKGKVQKKIGEIKEVVEK